MQSREPPAGPPLTERPAKRRPLPGFSAASPMAAIAGPLSRVELRTASQNDDLALGLSHDAVLVWIDPKANPENGPPGSGTPGSPQQIWGIEHISDPARVGGFGLALMLDGKRLATIPIEHDRLVAGKATTASGLTIRASRP